MSSIKQHKNDNLSENWNKVHPTLSLVRSSSGLGLLHFKQKTPPPPPPPPPKKKLKKRSTRKKKLKKRSTRKKKKKKRL